MAVYKNKRGAVVTSIYSRLKKLEVQIARLPVWQRIPLQTQLANVRAQFARSVVVTRR